MKRTVKSRATAAALLALAIGVEGCDRGLRGAATALPSPGVSAAPPALPILAIPEKAKRELGEPQWTHPSRAAVTDLEVHPTAPQVWFATVSDPDQPAGEKKPTVQIIDLSWGRPVGRWYPRFPVKSLETLPDHPAILVYTYEPSVTRLNASGKPEWAAELDCEPLASGELGARVACAHSDDAGPETALEWLDAGSGKVIGKVPAKTDTLAFALSGREVEALDMRQRLHLIAPDGERSFDLSSFGQVLSFDWDGKRLLALTRKQGRKALIIATDESHPPEVHPFPLEFEEARWLGDRVIAYGATVEGQSVAAYQRKGGTLRVEWSYKDPIRPNHPRKLRVQNGEVLLFWDASKKTSLGTTLSHQVLALEPNGSVRWRLNLRDLESLQLFAVQRDAWVVTVTDRGVLSGYPIEPVTHAAKTPTPVSRSARNGRR